MGDRNTLGQNDTGEICPALPGLRQLSAVFRSMAPQRNLLALLGEQFRQRDAPTAGADNPDRATHAESPSGKES
jgi:hypothetical protein